MTPHLLIVKYICRCDISASLPFFVVPFQYIFRCDASALQPPPVVFFLKFYNTFVRLQPHSHRAPRPFYLFVYLLLLFFKCTMAYIFRCNISAVLPPPCFCCCFLIVQYNCRCGISHSSHSPRFFVQHICRLASIPPHRVPLYSFTSPSPLCGPPRRAALLSFSSFYIQFSFLFLTT